METPFADSHKENLKFYLMKIIIISNSNQNKVQLSRMGLETCIYFVSWNGNLALNFKI